MLLLTELCSIRDELWPTRVHLLFRVLFRSMNNLASAFVCERVLLPVLRLISRLASNEAAPAPKPKPTFSSSSISPVALLDPSPVSSVPTLIGSASEPAASQQRPSDRIVHPHVSLCIGDWLRSPDTVYEAWAGRTASIVVEPSAAPAARALALARKYSARWRRKEISNATSKSAPGASSWLCRLLLCEASQSVREEAAGLLSTLADGSNERALTFLDILLGMLPGACASPRSSAEYFDLLRGLMTSPSRKLYMVAHGSLSLFCTLIHQEAQRIREQEKSSMVDMAQGFALKTILDLLGSLLELPTVLAKFKRALASAIRPTLRTPSVINGPLLSLDFDR